MDGANIFAAVRLAGAPRFWLLCTLYAPICGDLQKYFFSSKLALHFWETIDKIKHWDCITNQRVVRSSYILIRKMKDWILVIAIYIFKYIEIPEIFWENLLDFISISSIYANFRFRHVRHNPSSWKYWRFAYALCNWLIGGVW